MNLKIKYIHHVRNPYDCIATKGRYGKHEKPTKEIIEHHFSFCRNVVEIKKQIDKTDVFEERHESFIDDPKAYLRKLCRFLEEECPESYLTNCANIVFKSPHKSRYKIQWDDELIYAVKKRIGEFDFLKGYSFAD